MDRRTFTRIFLLVLGMYLMGSNAQGQAAATLPENLEVHPALRPFVAEMWQKSPLFRRQCHRLRAERRLVVQVELEPGGRPAHVRARTAVRHEGGALVNARIYTSPSPDAVELIAHEMEHVLEQLDGVDLHGQAGNGVVWKSGDASFETRRAVEAGRRVAAELGLGSPSVGEPGPPRLRGRLQTMPQRDPAGQPSARPSARVSANGRFVAFTSQARLAETDRNDFADVYVLDLRTGAVTLESVAPGGAPSDGGSGNADISGDGRYVVFESMAGSLAGVGFEPGMPHIFLRDRRAGTTRLLTAGAAGHAISGGARHPVISDDGSSVAFEAAADSPHAGERGPSTGIYLIRLATGERSRVDVFAAGDTPAESTSPALSGDGRFVAFASRTAAASPGARPVLHVYVRDTTTGITARVGGRAARDPDGPSYHPSISADGRYVAFVSEASNLPGSTRGRRARAQVYVHDRVAGTTELVSRRADGEPADGPNRFPAISADGSVVAFQSLASNLTCTKRCLPGERDSNLLWDVYVVDRRLSSIVRASAAEAGGWTTSSRGPSLDSRGAVVTFSSRQPIDEEDEGHDEDLYVWLADPPPDGRAGVNLP